MKRIKAYELGVSVMDCRYRPLNQYYDDYNPHRRDQTNQDYYIHPKWTDAEVKQFRMNVRRNNICLRHNTLFHHKDVERNRIHDAEKYRGMTYNEVKEYLPDAWNPLTITEVMT